MPWEWKNARSLGKHIVPVLPEEPGLKPDLKEFPRWIREHDHWKDPSDRDHLIAHLKGRPMPPRPVPFRVPDKPHTYVQRENEYGALRDLLLDDKHENPVANTTAIHGGGGFGKTTLAKALCHDEQIYDAFTDGIVWVELGPDAGDSEVLAGLRTLYQAFTTRPATFTQIGDGARQLSEELTNKKTAALIVIDDVWHRWQLDPFLEVGPECARLFTTRQAAIVADVHAREVPVDEMTESESIALLRNQLTEKHRATADEESLRRLATRVGEMAIMLELVAKQLNDALRRGKPFPEALRFVEKILDSKQIAFFRRDGGVRREDSIARTIEASLDPEFLDQPGHRQRALELGVFPAETELPPEQHCYPVAIRRPRRCRARRDAPRGDGPDQALGQSAADARGLPALLFRECAERCDPASLHARLIDGWGDLHSLPDIYAWRHLAHHLIEAGRKDQLRELLLDYGWLRAKLRATDWIALKDDAARCLDDPDLRYHARAFGLSAHVLARDPSMLRGQLCGRLIGIESAGIQGLVEQIGQAAEEGPWLRPLRPSLTPADSPEVTLVKNPSSLTAVAVTADGRTAISGSQDRTVRVWDLATGNARTLKGQGCWVEVVAVTADGRTAVSASSDCTVRVWHLATGQVRATFHGDTSVISVRCSPTAGCLPPVTSPVEFTSFDSRMGQSRQASWRIRAHRGDPWHRSCTSNDRVGIPSTERAEPRRTLWPCRFAPQVEATLFRAARVHAEFHVSRSSVIIAFTQNARKERCSGDPRGFHRMHGQPEVFISFASRDGEAFAEAVRVRLDRESPALGVWKDHVSLEGGLQWWDQIKKALDNVRFLVLIVTPSVLHEDLAPVVQKELRYARQQGVWIYPVMGAPKEQIPLEKFPHWLGKLTKTTFYDFRPAWPCPWDRPPPPGHDYQFGFEWDRFVRQLDRPGRVGSGHDNDQ